MSFAPSPAVTASSETSPWSQLIVDCFGCNHEACCDLDRGYEFLDKVPVRLGLVKQAQPYIFKTCEAAFPGKPGYSGWMPLEEGGVQIHTSANNRFISIDLLVRHEVEIAVVEEIVREWFQPAQIETRRIVRGQNAGESEVGRTLAVPAAG
jgi:S-adenosylmethionine/arginine decarboxylase-like enzyme